jgi:ribosomal protein S27AE
MPSDEERGAYGTGGKVKNWDKYNPWGYKIKPFKEEYICPLCESKADVVFPITMDLCPRCAEKVMERKDIYWTAEKKIDVDGHFCVNCGEFSIVYYTVNTRICNKCTRRLGANQTKYREWLKIARKV